MSNKSLVKIAAGYDVNVALTRNGNVWTWGKDVLPRKVEIAPAADISLKFSHVLCLTKNNRLYAWGDNQKGECGQDNQSNSIEQPTLVKGLDGLKIKKISAGLYHSLVICSKKN